MWVHQICRLCSQVSELLFPIFEKEGERARLDLKIKKCLALMITEEDPKPKQICYSCCNKLEDFNEFLGMCQASDYKFESIIFGPTANQSPEQSVILDRTKWPCDKVEVIPEELTPHEQQMTVQHDGVIVVGKVDESQNLNRECQDILLMVELKYKDVDIDAQSEEIMKQNKILYQENDILQDKQMMFTQGVLRHSDDFNKIQEKTDTQNLDLEQLQYTESQHSYIQQPIELIKSNSYTNCIQETKATKVVSKTKPFPCTHCNKSFMRRSNLNAHMSTHTQVRPYQCEQCDRSFAVRFSLTVHQRLHSGLYSCEFCGKAFPVKGKLERHRRIHTGEKPFVCTTSGCDKAFADKRNLEAHIRTHSEERPFTCEICSRGFRSKSHLTDHQRVHSQEAPFTCDTCGKSFKWKTNLTIHLRGHSGQKSICADCGKQFARTTQLSKHRRLHHSGSSLIFNKKNNVQ